MQTSGDPPDAPLSASALTPARQEKSAGQHHSERRAGEAGEIEQREGVRGGEDDQARPFVWLFGEELARTDHADERERQQWQDQIPQQQSPPAQAPPGEEPAHRPEHCERQEEN